MTTISPPPRLSPASAARARRQRLNKIDFRANRALMILAGSAGALIVIVMIAVLLEMILGASQAISHFGLSFVTSTAENAARDQYGALPYIYGTLVTSVFSLIFSAILGISIGLFLSLMAPTALAVVISPLVELLAAIPTVVLGLIGIIVIAPFAQSTLMPIFHSVLGWTPFFGTVPNTGESLFTASLVLTILVVPIIAALTRDVFMTVPQDLKDGAEALGATRWEMIRGVVLPTTISGMAGACVLGFARALGEAIAIISVIGNQPIIRADTFLPAATMAGYIANEFESPQDPLNRSAMLYLVLILFAISIAANLFSRWIVKRGTRFS